MMEWDEFTRFVVVKAQLHHAQMSIDQLAEYRQGSRQVRIGLGSWCLRIPPRHVEHVIVLTPV